MEVEDEEEGVGFIEAFEGDSYNVLGWLWAEIVLAEDIQSGTANGRRLASARSEEIVTLIVMC